MWKEKSQEGTGKVEREGRRDVRSISSSADRETPEEMEPTGTNAARRKKTESKPCSMLHPREEGTV